MNTTKHTRGPWGQDDRNPKRVVAPWKDREISSSRFVALTVAICESEEDARLIAASPELLTSLEEIERLSREADGNLVDVRAMLGEVARAAIAKATGGAA